MPILTYVDTSAWVASLCREAQSEQVAGWLSLQTPQNLAGSEWVKTEIYSALSIKCRRNELDASYLQSLHASFEAVFSSGTRWDTPLQADFTAAVTLCKDYTNGLRGSDALHLVMALRMKCSHFFSLDRILNKNASALGFKLIEL